MSDATRFGNTPEGAAESPVPPVESYDDIARGLHRLRSEAGGISYARITQRIERARRERGVDEYSARLARSTVYDAFRSGRTRLSADLVEEIVLALGVDAEAARGWRERCLHARPTPAPVPVPAPAPTPAPVPVQERDPVPHTVPAEESAPDGRPRPLGGEGLRVAPGGMAGWEHPGPWVVLTVLCLCLALNLAGKYVNQGMQLPLYMDMTGTAVAAIALGPWYGVTVGLAGNALGTFTDGPGALLFAPVNMVGALIWGYGVRRFGKGRSLVSFFRLCMVAAAGCTFTAAPVILLLFPGRELSQTGALGEVFGSAGASLVFTVFSANGAYSMVDKLLTGFVALVILQRLHARVPGPGPAPHAAVPPNSAVPPGTTGRGRLALHAFRCIRPGRAVRKRPETARYREF